MTDRRATMFAGPTETVASGTTPVSPRPSRRGGWWRRWPVTLPHVILIPLVLLWIYPFLWMLSGSFKTLPEMLTGGAGLIPHQPTLDNYTRAWRTGQFGEYLLNSVIVSVAVAVLVIFVASLAGYALGRGHMPGKKIVVAGLVATMFLPHGFTIIPVFEVVNTLGLDNSLAGVILALSGPAHIVAILLFMGYFASIPNELEEAAVIDGAGPLRIYAQIMLPLAKPVIGTVALFNLIDAWNAFLIPLLFTLSRPDLRTVGVGIYAFFGEFGTDWTGLAAAAVLTIAPIVIVFLWLQRMFVEGIAGAVKS